MGVIDLDIEKYFDTVNHDKLVSILRERINDAPILHLIRSFLRVAIQRNLWKIFNRIRFYKKGSLFRLP